MSHIKSIHIEGFKKFSNIDISFDPHMNILVGENEAGKSTILEAIRIVLNQQYRNADKSVLSDLFNAENVTAFKANPSIKTLPQIVIELFLELDAYKKMPHIFTEKSTAAEVKKMKNMESDSNANLMPNLAPAWKALSAKAIYHLNTTH